MRDEEFPLVSVIVPCFNLETVIAKCIESILAQTYPHFELLIIDDGSTDGSREIVRSFAARDRRIVPVYRQNGGAGAAYNAGLLRASGAYLYIVDGDNYIERDLLRVMMAAVRRDDVDLVLCDYFLDIYANGRYAAKGFLRYPPTLLKDRRAVLAHAFPLYAANLLQSPCNKLYRARLLRGMRFAESRARQMIVDSDFHLRLLPRVERAAVLGVPLVHYVQYDAAERTQITSLWRAWRREAVFSEERLLELFRAYYEEAGASERQRQAMQDYFAGRFLQLAKTLFLDDFIRADEKARELAFLRAHFSKAIPAETIAHLPYRLMARLLLCGHTDVFAAVCRVFEAVRRYAPNLAAQIKA